MASAASASASVVNFELLFNGSSTPAPITVGGKVTVDIYAEVTENTHNYFGSDFDFGLGLYGLNLDGGNELKPDPSFPPTKWNAINKAGTGIFDKGTLSGNKVLSVGGATAVPEYDVAFYGSPRTLLASGTFTAIAEGNATLGTELFVHPNVFIVNGSGNLAYAMADLVTWSPVPVLNVMPVPEPSAMLFGAGLTLAALSRRRSAAARRKRL